MDASSVVTAIEAVHGMLFALGCVGTFALGWIGGHQR